MLPYIIASVGCTVRIQYAIRLRGLLANAMSAEYDKVFSPAATLSIIASLVFTSGVSPTSTSRSMSSNVISSKFMLLSLRG